MDATLRLLASLFTDCLSAGVRSDDVATAVKWTLANGGLSEAQAIGHIRVLQGRLA